jgi:ABC-type multidrug transport system ATPase subunit
MRRIKEISMDKLPIRVNEIRKTYDNAVAIKSLSFGLEFGECFALLGISGSGKSTCFKCLTGEIYPSLGNISICGFDVTSTSGFERARK